MPPCPLSSSETKSDCHFTFNWASSSSLMPFSCISRITSSKAASVCSLEYSGLCMMRVTICVTQMVTRIMHKPEYSSEQTLAAFDEVLLEVRDRGIGADELEEIKVKWRSDYYSTLEGGRGGYMPRYGLMHLLACFTLFDDEPELVNTILDDFLAVAREDVHAAAKKYLRQENRAIVFRTPVKSDAREAA